MMDPQMVKMARVLVDYSLGLGKDDVLLLSAGDLAAPLVRAVYQRALECGAHVETRIALSGLGEIMMDVGSDEQLAHESAIDMYTLQNVSAYLAIQSAHNTRALSRVDPHRQAARSKAHAPIQNLIIRQSDVADFRWCATLFPTNAFAQDAGLSLTNYENFVFKACLLDQDDPAAAWHDFSVRQQRICDHLSNCSTVRILAEDTDFTVSVAGRHWINADGKRNMPDGEVFTGPVETSAEGHIRFNYPAVFHGNAVSDVHLWFEKGRITRWEAGEGAAFLEQMLSMDEGARFLGEFAIGNNFGITDFSRNVLFDEKIGGTFHVAAGASYPATGGTNASALHWDMVCDLRRGGRILADSEVIQEDGAWKI